MENKINDFRASFCPFGYQDIGSLITTAELAGKDTDWCVDMIEEFSNDCGVPMEKVDPNYVVWDSLLQEARTDIENKTGVDILNDLSDSLDVSGNYMCTTLDGKEKAYQDTQKVIEKIPEDERSEVVNWLYDQIIGNLF